MKELGGYFELELNKGKAYHSDAIALNSARNCLKYIIQAKKPTKVYLPAYCCDSLIEPLISEKIDYEFYHIDSNFELSQTIELQEHERLIYINYFSLKSNYIEQLTKQYGKSLIIDNTQAFFEMPLNGIDTFYSPRKFFGVADGGYLYTDNKLAISLEQDNSASKFTQLIGRYEQTASEFYADFQSAENALIDETIKTMSKLTQGILNSLDYEKIALKRQRNFWALHAMLSDVNQFKNFEQADFVPMVYPFKTQESELRTRLIRNKIYVAQYWADASNRLKQEEQEFINNMIFLPIDQRLDLSELIRVREVV
jgi:hypothetical protein